MHKALALVLLLLSSATCWAEGQTTPSKPTWPEAIANDTAAISLNAATIHLSLSDAIYLGLRNNRAISSAYLNRIAQKFDLRVAEDFFTPKLRINGNYTTAHSNADRSRQGELSPTATLVTPYGTRASLGWTYQHTTANQAGSSRNDGANISIVQPLLRGAGYGIANAPLQLAKLNEQINRLRLKSSVSQTITQIIYTYRELLRSQEQVRIAQDSLERARQLLGVNKALIAAGRMAEFEIVQTEAELATQELSYEDTHNQKDKNRLALLQLLALDMHTQVIASDTLQASPIQANAAQALHQAESSQPAYLSQLIINKQAEIQLLVARNKGLWDISLIGGASQTRDRSPSSTTSRSWNNYLGIQVEIPIGDLSTRQAAVHAEVNRQTQSIQLQEIRQQLEHDTINAVRDIDVRWKQYEIAQRARDLSLRKLDIERQKLTVGRSSNFQILSFENDLRNAENARLNTVINYLNAQAELDQTLGTTLDSWDISLND